MAETERAAETADAAVHEAQEKLDQIAGRITALESERAEIVARRTAGDRRDDDGARLAAMAADQEGLAKLRTDAATRGLRRELEKLGPEDVRRAIAEVFAAQIAARE